MEERKIFGPPGCGKTTYLMEKAVPPAVERFGSDRVVVTSFSKAAAHELAAAKATVDPQNVGTLHSLCYRAMGSPKIAEVHGVKLWNEQYPPWSISGNTMSGLEDGMDDYGSNSETDGDDALNMVNRYRSRLVSPSEWRTTAYAFYKKWEEFKRSCNFIDFTDMIEYAVENMQYAPGNPGVIIVDEAQDLTPLQLKLIRSWGLMTKWFVLVGDDDQAIYSFMGADPKAFIARSGYEKKEPMVLEQSYRVPAEVLKYSQHVIHYVMERHDKIYYPRRANGTVVQGAVLKSRHSYKQADEIVDMMLRYAQAGESVMFLATCSYMLDPVKQCLIKESIPFHNPYRKRRADWNPLARGSKNKTTARDLLANFLAMGEDNGYWTVEQFMHWAKFVMVGDNGLIRKQGKALINYLEGRIAEGGEELKTCRNVIGDILNPPAVEAALRRDTKWLLENLQTRKKGTLEFPMQIAAKYGVKALNEAPKCIIGTIHSVKGGQADNVIMAPDLSVKAAKSCSKRENRDDICRVYYVGATRTRNELVVLQQAMNPRASWGSNVRRNPIKI